MFFYGSYYVFCASRKGEAVMEIIYATFSRASVYNIITGGVISSSFHEALCRVCKMSNAVIGVVI